jgi:hypothetical protein
LSEHAPGRLIGDSQFPLKLFSGYSSPSRPHQIHCVEPQPERCTGMFQYCARHRINMSSARITDIARPIRDFMVECDAVTL